MNSELQILKKIWESDGSQIKSISKQTGFGMDYVRYICSCLLKKGKIKAIKGKRDWYQIAPQGKKELEHRGLIKLPLLKKVKDIEKVVYYFPKKLSHHSIKSTPSKKTKVAKNDPESRVLGTGQKINIKIKRPKNNLPDRLAVLPAKRTSKAGLIEADEKKLNLGRTIMKAVSFLKKSPQAG